jgi:hypothetical protein
VGSERLLALCLFALAAGCARSGEPDPRSETSADSGFVFEQRIGLAGLQPDGSGCLAVFDPAVGVGTRVALIDQQPTDEATTLSEGVVSGTLASCGGRLADPSSTGTVPSLYVVSLAPGSSWAGGAVIAVVEPPEDIAKVDGVVATDLDGDGTRESFGVCASSEGLHYLVWTGSALDGRLRWHRYLYLGYDLEPSCTDREYAEIARMSG